MPGGGGLGPGGWGRHGLVEEGQGQAGRGGAAALVVVVVVEVLVEEELAGKVEGRVQRSGQIRLWDRRNKALID